MFFTGFYQFLKCLNTFFVHAKKTGVSSLKATIMNQYKTNDRRISRLISEDKQFLNDLLSLTRLFINSFDSIRFLKKVNNKSLLQQVYHQINAVLVHATIYHSEVDINQLEIILSGLRNCSGELTVEDYHSKAEFVISFEYSINRLESIIRELTN